jgi:hypothetical protein
MLENLFGKKAKKPTGSVLGLESVQREAKRNEGAEGSAPEKKRTESQDDLNGLLTQLQGHRKRLRSAEQIVAKLGRGFLDSAVAANRGVTFADGSGPGLDIAELNAQDARTLARSGIDAFRKEVRGSVDRIAARLEQQTLADVPLAIGGLLAIMATTENDKADLRKGAGYFLIDELGGRAGAAVESALTDPDANIRFQAAHVLRFLHSERAVGALISALADPDGGVRAMVAQALALQGDKRAIEPLMQTAEKDPSEGVRQRAKAAVEKLQRK